MSSPSAHSQGPEPTLQRFSEAWNKHDSKALAAEFTRDGDVINPAGRAAQGAADLETLFAQEHSTACRTSTMSISPQNVRYLRPDLAVVTAKCAITGMRTAAGKEFPMDAICTFILDNSGGAWRIAVARPMAPLTPE